MCSLLLDDGTDGASTVCNIFRSSPDELPHVSRAGDVVVLQEAGLQEWQGQVQLLGRTTCTITVLSRDRDESDAFYFALDEGNFSPEQQEGLVKLWQWGQTRLRTEPTMKRETRFRLCDTQVEEAGDTTVMVCGMYVPMAGHYNHMPKGMLRVWDGTGPPVSDA